MQAKTLLIPLAAFALTATTASAFNPEVLAKAGLTDSQIEAFEEARDLRKEGDQEKAREVLEQAGIDISTMESVREAMHEYKDAMREAIDEALENNDFEAFKDAVVGSPLADIITTEADFESFKEAHELMEQGEFDEAHAIMEELGMPHGKGFGFGHMLHNNDNLMHGPGFGMMHAFKERDVSSDEE